VPGIALLFGQVLVYAGLNYFYPDASIADHTVFSIQVNAAVITLLLSCSYHTMICHSKEVENLMLRVDYVGILTLILGSFFSGIYVGFYCEPLLCRTYWAMIISLSVVTATLVLHPRLQGLKYRTLRTWTFILTALSGFAPIIHGLLLYGWREMWVRSGMPYWLLEGLMYGIGVFFFISRVPESIWPGRFDIWFSSHQFFHVFVVMASLVHLYGVWVAFDWNYTHQRACKL
jgi:adiponectin receptor